MGFCKNHVEFMSVLSMMVVVVVFLIIPPPMAHAQMGNPRILSVAVRGFDGRCSEVHVDGQMNLPINSDMFVELVVGQPLFINVKFNNRCYYSPGCGFAQVYIPKAINSITIKRDILTNEVTVQGQFFVIAKFTLGWADGNCGVPPPRVHN
ncbi:unnamed protein product [Sphagnum jensenii]|jgi:hypothetical protein|uniref:Uncharacterized protein n=1 Tax=Sphagnum jensenii TaxID=128206 RepID=A0ABP0WMF0_9BRYO